MEMRASESIIGGEVLNFDLSVPQPPKVMAELVGFFYQRSVIVIRDQNLGGKALLDFARRFGEPDQNFLTHYAHPDFPNIMLISNVVEEGRHIGYADAGRVWHSDGSYLQRPVAVTMLYALEVPHEGGRALGDTAFASAWAAYDGLSSAQKHLLKGLEAIHEVAGRRRTTGTGEDDRAEHEAQPPAHHPLVRVHPVTGRKYIFVAKGECTSITGMTEVEGLGLIDALASEIEQPQYRFVHQWRPGDLLVWDNQAVQHLASFDYEWPKHRRLMHRVTVLEDPPPA